MTTLIMASSNLDFGGNVPCARESDKQDHRRFILPPSPPFDLVAIQPTIAVTAATAATVVKLDGSMTPDKYDFMEEDAIVAFADTPQLRLLAMNGTFVSEVRIQVDYFVSALVKL